MKKYQSYSLHNFHKIPQIQTKLTEEQINAIKVVGNVLPFKVNNYVVDELINWDNIPDDPIFQLTFPQKVMLSPDHYQEMEEALAKKYSKPELKLVANKIRYELNPHPAGQKNNIPILENQKLTGIQHKYRETALFFPSNGQTCHAYCSFCFRWPQFVGMEDMKFASKEVDSLIAYLRCHPEITDVLFTGGDPMIMSAKKLEAYILPLLEADLPHLQNIRIGTKVIGYWPYKFTTDKDATAILNLFTKVVKSGKHLAFMAHFSHPVELETVVAQEAIQKIKATGAVIRTQSPIMKGLNDTAEIWADMWKKQVKLGCSPYYMFVARDTGAQDYFAVPIVKALASYQKAYRKISGIARTARGPVMSTYYGKVMVMGIQKVAGIQTISLKFLQGRNPNWVGKIFFAKYNEEAIWLDELEPAFADEWFFTRQKQEVVAIA